MEQILINLITGALGGVATGKSSPTFDLGTIGNIISGLVGGGVLGQVVTLATAIGRGRSTVRQSECRRCCITSDCRWRWRRNTHGDHWCNQEQSDGLILPLKNGTQLGLFVPFSLQQLADQVIE